MFRGSVKGIGYPLHPPVSPSLPLPCVTVCHHISTGVYKLRESKIASVYALKAYGRVKVLQQSLLTTAADVDEQSDDAVRESSVHWVGPTAGLDYS